MLIGHLRRTDSLDLANRTPVPDSVPPGVQFGRGRRFCRWRGPPARPALRDMHRSVTHATVPPLHPSRPPPTATPPTAPPHYSELPAHPPFPQSLRSLRALSASSACSSHKPQPHTMARTPKEWIRHSRHSQTLYLPYTTARRFVAKLLCRRRKKDQVRNLPSQGSVAPGFGRWHGRTPAVSGPSPDTQSQFVRGEYAVLTSPVGGGLPYKCRTPGCISR
jgi:hypothetical protein